MNEKLNEKDSPETSSISMSAEKKEVDSEKSKIWNKNIALVLVISVVVSAFIGAIAGYAASSAGNKSLSDLMKNFKGTEVASNSELNTADLQNLAAEEAAVVNAVNQSSKAVVSIIITKDVPKLDNFFSNPFFDDPFFSPFGFQQQQQQQQGEPETEKQEIGGGTGFIVSEEGFIVTNRHVVADENAEYTVVMNDGQKFEAEVMARDPHMDLAIIKIDAGNDLPVLQLGDSDQLRIGQTVIAIGNSLGEFRNTVSKGIVSGLKRDVSAGNGLGGQSELLEEVIQTDAAINPGNSGGPIVNLQGQAVGVNVAMAFGAENIGFAIPINEVKKIYQSVKDNGKIIRPFLGVRYAMINKQVQQANDLEMDYGAILVKGATQTDLAVMPGSPADKAGLTENDIILEIDGQKLSEENDLVRIIKKKNVGDEITLKVWSKGDIKTVKVTLEESK